MLYIFITCLIVFPVLIGFGEWFQRYFGKLWEGTSAQMVSGMMFLMVLWHLLAFFTPINFYVELGSVLVGILLFFYYKSYSNILKIKTRNKVLFIVLSLISFFVGSGYPFILDHFGYYVPSIKWLSEFGLVRGIVNLDWVLGQMSPWHIFQTGFSHFSDSFLRINTLLLVIFFLYVLEKRVWSMLCFSPILFFFVQSPSPDLPSMVFALMILNEILEYNKKISLLFVFSMLVFSIKPTMFWLPILTFFYPILFYKSDFKFVSLGFGIGILYLVKNVWVFGYPFFPIQFWDFGVPWKPYSVLFLKSNEIAVLKTFDLQYTLEEIKGFSTIEYLLNWMFLDGIKGIINTGLILGLIIFTIFTFIKKDKLIGLIFISILIKSLFILWFSAQYRFFIEVFLVIFVVVLGSYFSKKSSLIIFSILGLSMTGILLFPKVLKEQIPSFNVGYFMQGFEWKQFYQPSHYVFNQSAPYKVGNLSFNVPRNYVFGFDVNLPVITRFSLEEFETLGIFPQIYDSELGKGFIWRYLKDEEKQKLRTIIEKIKKEEE